MNDLCVALFQASEWQKRLLLRKFIALNVQVTISQT